MQKLLACIGFIFCALTLYLTSSNAGMKWITQDRYSRIGALGADKYLYGDLYGLTYLSKFKITKDTNFVSIPTKDGKVHSDKANLFILGDSYLYSFFKEDPRYYANIGQVKFIRWDVAKPIEIIPARNKKNILLIESVERNMSGLFNLNSVKARLDRAEAVQSELNTRQKIAHFFAEIDEGIMESLYHKSLEANIEFAWFNFGFLEPLKELKADFNLNFFGRVDKEVAISKDQNFLYLAETLNPNNPGSSFSDISEEKLKAQVSELNRIQDYYKARGFDEVILSIIPNPVSVLKTENRPDNHLIQRIKLHPDFKGKLIDATEELSKNAKSNFFTSDSHWNQKGAKIWLDQLNRQLPNLTYLGN
jgi:hypothetical protein